MTHTYKIWSINEKEKWIFIQTEDWDEPGAFVSLVKRIAKSCDGVMKDVGDDQYKIVGDKFDLIYQWDTCFGFVVIYKNERHEVVNYLEGFFDET